MKRNITFNYCKDFKCVDKNCKHNCCTKWQIDIDGKTLKKYQVYVNDNDNEFSKALRNGVDFSDRRFVMKTVNGEKRCAFLNDENLCEIIINLGENYLSKTCKVHPRFKTFLPDRIETGVSLACEEGARRLLTFHDKIALTDNTEEPDDKTFIGSLKKMRKDALRIVQDDKKDINERIDNLLTYYRFDKIKFYGADYKKVLNSLNILDSAWQKRIDKIDIKNISVKKEYAHFVENLLSYFILKHLLRAQDRLDALSRIGFCVFGALTIYSIFINENNLNVEALIDIARAFSSEIEYDDDNIFTLLTEIEEYIIHNQGNL